MKPPARRCALYTRKSSEEGLDQAFNSLDAQREACAAYVTSQSGEGWRSLSDPYDDGGYSGGSMERPALKRLLSDIASGKIDIVVVYKIDRLTRSLADFARMVELFDRHEVSFVSVTQAFNTTSSMGRLTLNVLLSFAQFEREVTGERIRDKIAASKAKGMWMGGVPPMGYDLPIDQSRTLVVNPAEAQIVRTMFETYLQLGTVRALETWLASNNIRSRRRTTRSGRAVGGAPFSRGALFHLLRNRIYLGQIVHKTKAYPAAHVPIVSPDLFDKVQALLDGNAAPRSSTGTSGNAQLTGRLFDAQGHPMSPTTARGKSGKTYRYYVSAPLQQGRGKADPDTIGRVSGPALEASVSKILRRVAPTNSPEPWSHLKRVEVHTQMLELHLPLRWLAHARSRLLDGELIVQDTDRARLTVPIQLQTRGGRTRIAAGPPGVQRDPVLIRALRLAHRLIITDRAGDPIVEAAPATPYHRRIIRLAFLAPDIQRAILAGRQPPGLTLEQISRGDIPVSWHAQKHMFGFV
ncbi:MAG: recombinase family protein [Sphingomonas sp.]|nr:recombinase family protein [Sphingomonas sp.]